LLGFTEASRESDKMHLLALRHICLLCIDLVDTRYLSLRKGGETHNIRELSSNTMEDEFENFVYSANELQLAILEEKLMDCIDIINNLLTEI
jgi:hypothetical protein